MADPGAAVGGDAGGVAVEPPPGSIPPPGEGLGPDINPLESLPSSNYSSFCTINERGIGSLDLVDLSSTIIINLVVFLFLLCVFERMRHKKSIYFPRDEWLKHRKPPELPKGFLAWVRPLMAIPQEKILQLAGLDAYMLLRYIRLCLKVCLASGFFGLVVLVPLYLHGNAAKPYDGRLRTIMRDPKLISMGNIKDQAYLWVPIAFAYFTTLHTLYLLKKEYKRFLTLRLTYMSVGDPDVNVQKSFSIMVDRIPYEYRSNAALFALFDEIFPGDVHSAVVALRIDGLEALVARRARVLTALESAVATRQVSGGKEPSHFVPDEGNRVRNRLRGRGRRVESIPYYQAELDRLNAAITKVQVAIRMESDAINRKEEARQESRRQLQQQHRHHPSSAMSLAGRRRLSVSPFLVGDAESRINLMGQKALMDEVISLEGATQLDSEGLTVSIDAEAGDDDVPLPSFIHTPQRRPAHPGAAASATASSSTRQLGVSSSGNGSGHGNGTQQQSQQLPEPESLTVAVHGLGGTTGTGTSSGASPYDEPQPVMMASSARRPSTATVRGPSTVAEEKGENEGEENAPAAAGAGAGGAAGAGGEYGGYGEAEEDDVRMCRLPKQGVWGKVRELLRRALHLGKSTARSAVVAGKEVTKAVGLLATNTNMSSTGFVTFKSMSSAAVASQSLLTMEPFMFTITPAPEPRDIAFSNVSTPLRLVEWREATTTLLIVFLSIFWGGLVSALYKFQSWLQTRSDEEPALQDVGYWGRFFLYLGIDYVPTVILLIIMALLPLFFWWTSLYYEKMRTYSDCDASVMSRYFYYQMVNIYATIVGGALLDEVVAIAKDPRVIVRVLGCQVPVVAVYFMQVIVTKALSALMWEFSRAWPLIRQTFIHAWVDYDRITERQRRTDLLYKPAMYYGWTYPSLLLVLTVCLTYDVIMPVTLLLGVVYFFLVEILYTYHLLYVYSPQYESGGKLWYKVFTRTLVALLLSHVTLIGYMAVLGASNLVPVLVPLPILLVPFYRHCENGYHEASLKLSLLAARRIDASLREEGEEDEEEGGNENGGEGAATGTGVGAGAGGAGAAGSPEAVDPIAASFPTSPQTTHHHHHPTANGGRSQEHPVSTATASSSSAASFFFPGSLNGAASTTGGSVGRGGSGGPGRGMGRRRRSTTTVAATPAPMDARGPGGLARGSSSSSLEAALLVHEPPLVVDYFEISAYAQPSLTEGPQQAENLPENQRPSAHEALEELVPHCAMAPSSTSVSPRPLSLSASAHAALAKRLGKNPEAADDLVDGAMLKPPPPSSGGSAMAPGSTLRPLSSLGVGVDTADMRPRSMGQGQGQGQGQAGRASGSPRNSQGSSQGSGGGGGAGERRSSGAGSAAAATAAAAAAAAAGSGSGHGNGDHRV